MSMDRDDETFGSEARDPEKTAVLAGRTLFGSLFQQNVNRIFGYARHLRKGHEAPIRSDILDAVQDASVNFLSRPRKIKSDSHFVNLFKGFVRNAFLGRQRGEKAGKRGGQGQEIDRSISEVVGINPRTGPSTAASRADRNEHLAAAIQRLDHENRKIIYLRIWEDTPWGEVARRLDLVSEDAARMKYNRALEQLRKIISSTG